jgi:DNA-binding NtrC family response regulator
MRTVLVADDDSSVRFILSEFLINNGFDPIEAHNSDAAVEAFRNAGPSLVLLDLDMPGMDGMKCMEEIRKIDPMAPVIVLTGRRDVEAALSMTRSGAYDFALKPPEFDRLIMTIRKALEKRDMEATLRASVEGLFGKGRAMSDIAGQVLRVAPSDSPVMIQGEGGSGKSFIARKIHDLSRRSDGPFVSVDAGGIPDDLVEGQFFGSKKGSSSGTDLRGQGWFEISRRGTLVLDRAHKLSPYGQGALLKALDDERYFPLEYPKGPEVDSRIISLAGPDIARTVKQGGIREDLFFKLGENIIVVPPLRERRDEIPILARRFLRDASEGLKKGAKLMSDEAIDYLCSHSWPGNLRELRSAIRMALLLSSGEVIEKKDIQIDVVRKGPGLTEPHLSPLKDVLNRAEELAIRRALSLTQGNRAEAARALGISPGTLRIKMKVHSIL